MEDVVTGILKLIGRAIGQVFIELIFELLIKSPGCLIIKLLSRRNEKQPTENKLIIVGLLFWCFVGGVAYWTFKYGI